MKHIRKFETTAGFEAERPSLALPNVSLVTQTNTINYLPYGGGSSEPEWVEINGVKWATKNLGAATIVDTGLYYQWGDTQGYTEDQVGNGEGNKRFILDDYKYYNGSGYTKYNETDSEVELDASDDAATAALGANWRMPTAEEVSSLAESCDYEYCEYYQPYGVQGPGASGYLFTDKTDASKTLFFPKSYYYNDYDADKSEGDYVWVNQLLPGSCDNNVPTAAIFEFSYKYGMWVNSMARYYGTHIRPVRTV